MKERVRKYLSALERRKKPLSINQLEVLSSDFDLSTKDLQDLAVASRRFILNDSLENTSLLDLSKELKDSVYGAYHSQSLLEEIIPFLLEEYRKTKLKIVYDMLSIAVNQSIKLGSDPEIFSSFLILENQNRYKNFFRKIWLIGFFIILLIIFAYWKGRDNNWFNFFSPSLSQKGIFVGSLVEEGKEPPLKESRNLILTTQVDSTDPLPLRVSQSSLIVFPESSLYDVRLGVTLPYNLSSYEYRVTVNDLQENEIFSREGLEITPHAGLWEGGTILPFVFQKFDLDSLKDVPYSLEVSLFNLVPVKEEEVLNLEKKIIPIINKSPQAIVLTGNLRKVEWIENFGIIRGNFLITLSQNQVQPIRSLEVRFILLNEALTQVASFTTYILRKDFSFPLYRGEKRNFSLTYDFIRDLVGDLPLEVYQYQLEVLSWE